jgi:hypothetical protein
MYVDYDKLHVGIVMHGHLQSQLRVDLLCKSVELASTLTRKLRRASLEAAPDVGGIVMAHRIKRLRRVNCKIFESSCRKLDY